MNLTEQQMAIVGAVAEFDSIERYQGILPRKHVLLFEEKEVRELLQIDILQKVKLIFPNGKRMKGLRLTVAGRRILDDSPTPIESKEPLPTPSQLTLLRDIAFASEMKIFHGIMPKKLVRQYNEKDLEDLYLDGYILRIKIYLEDNNNLKGTILTSKAKQLLNRLNQKTPTT